MSRRMRSFTPTIPVTQVNFLSMVTIVLMRTLTKNASDTGVPWPNISVGGGFMEDLTIKGGMLI